MGNLESAEGGPGEPSSVSLLPPPGKMPMPEPCELEERFALVLVRADPVPSPSYRPPPTPAQAPISAPRGGLCPDSSVRPTPSVRIPNGPRPPAPFQALSSPVGDLPSEASTSRHLGGGVPNPGPPQYPEFFLFSPPSAALRTSPHFLDSLPRSLGFSFLNLWRERGNSEALGRPIPQPQSGFSDWGDRLSC